MIENSVSKEIGLEFSLIDDFNRKFSVTFASESSKRNRLHAILFETSSGDLPLDVIELKTCDIRLYRNITKLMHSTAEDFWKNNNLSKQILTT